MGQLPKISDVVSHVLATAERAQDEKVAAEVIPPTEYTSDVALSLKKLADHLRSSPMSVTYEDVFATGQILLRTP